MGSTKVKLLQHTYDAIMNKFKLNRKSDFRAKMGAYEDPLYIAYPRHGLGSKGIKALMDFFGD
jgi:aspartyl-tRNA synthetase